MEVLIKKSLKVLEESCAEVFAGKQKSAFVCFDIPHSEYMAVIQVMKNAYGEKKWRISIGVMLEGDDKLLQVYTPAMNDNEVIEYFHK